MSPREIQTNENRMTFPSLRDFLDAHPESLPSGDYEIQHGKLPIFLRWRNAGRDVTVVKFSTAATRAMTTVPIFMGTRITADLDANVLLFADPSMLIDQKLLVGWFAGNKYQPLLQRHTTWIIAAFQGEGRVILDGASGGGFPALHQTRRLYRATTFLANPTVNITRRPTFKQYLALAWGVDRAEQLPDHVITDLTETFSTPAGNQVIYLQNSFDKTFMQDQLWPFAEASHPDNQIFYLTPYLGAGHVTIDKSTINRVLTTLVETPRWEDLKREFSTMPLTSAATPSGQRLSAASQTTGR